MKERLFGLKKSPINKFIKNLEWDFLTEKVRLEYELENILKENERLKEEVQEKAKARSLRYEEEELWAIGKERIANVIQSLSKQKEIEMASMRKQFSTKTSLINEQIQQVELEIVSTGELFSKMIQQLSSVVEQSQNSLFNSKTSMDELVESENIGFTSNGDVAENLLEQRLNEKEGNKEISNEDGSVSSNHTAVENIDGPMNQKYPDDSFWGGIEDFDQESDHWVNGDLLVPEPIKLPHQVESNDESGQNASHNPQVKINVGPVEKLEELHPTLDTIDEDLIDQIDKIKSQYIVGKVAGADLLDRDGNLIITKSTLISREVVERANRAGKLAELIVNMKLSTPGED